MLTYLDLPSLMSRPVVSDSSDDAGLVASLVLLDELFDSHVVHVDPLNRVHKSGWVHHFELLLLLVEVAILRPLAQQKAGAVF